MIKCWSSLTFTAERGFHFIRAMARIIEETPSLLQQNGATTIMNNRRRSVSFTAEPGFHFITLMNNRRSSRSFTAERRYFITVMSNRRKS